MQVTPPSAPPGYGSPDFGDGAPGYGGPEPAGPRGDGPPGPPGPWPPAGQPAPAAPASHPRLLRRAARRLWPHTLAGRLVVFVLSLVLVAVLSFGVVTYLALRTFLDQRLDQQLQTASSTLQALSLAPAQSAGVQPPQQLYFLPVTMSGDEIAAAPTSRPPRPDLSADQITALIADLGNPGDITTADGRELRAAAFAKTFTIDRQDEPSERVQGYAILGLSTDELHGTLNHLLLLELLIGAGVLLLASGLTTLGVRTGLRPLYRITRTARAVAAELSPEGTGLDRRVPQSDPDSEIGQLADSVNTMLEAVETQFAARRENEERMRQFLADASHELRTPLTSIRGYAELARLQRRAGSPGGSGDEDVLNRIEAEGTRMSRLVEDLLMLARSDRGVQPHFAGVEVAELIDDAVSGARAAYPDRPIEADVQAFELIADRDQLLRVLRNLITNAAVHTAPGGPITVTARSDGEWAWLSVADSGPGMEPGQSEHVFERFWRADKARARVRGGTGLGLAIVRAVVQAHGGAVRFRSTVAEGTTVTVTIPVVARPPAGEQDDERGDDAAAGGGPLAPKQ